MKKKEPVVYTVEREFLGKFSEEELLVRIIKSHLNREPVKKSTGSDTSKSANW